MHINSIIKGVILVNSHLIGTVCACVVLCYLSLPAKASTISSAPVNVHVGAPGDWVPAWDGGLTAISDAVEYPDYWGASHDIDEVASGSGVIQLQTDNSSLATNTQFSDCCGFTGFIYEFPTLNIISANLSSTNMPDIFTSSRIVLFSPTLIGIDASGLAWGFNVPGGINAPDQLIVSVDFQTAVPIPAAIWLFGSGLIGLIGVARRKKS